ncbi:hypothetical protein [uncultured Alistipes sp.]|uniref:hypothetical protein n=1 Tax=uncultured Alistipes sp. TaxID=538949 RepID=UPI00272AF27B|nr:hypothetical protein [uncultured Alistipes sp.]
MIRVITTIAWASLIIHVLDLIGTYIAARKLSDSKAFWAYVLLYTREARQNADYAVRLAAGCLRRAAVSAVVLALVYHFF